jgi:hypothetical protein
MQYSSTYVGYIRTYARTKTRDAILVQTVRTDCMEYRQSVQQVLTSRLQTEQYCRLRMEEQKGDATQWTTTIRATDCTAFNATIFQKRMLAWHFELRFSKYHGTVQ